MANDDLVVGVDFLGCSDEDWQWFLDWVVSQDIVSYNSMYDHGLIYAKTGKLVPPFMDCYGVFKSLGGKKRSDIPTSYGLKAAQIDLLDWEAQGNDEIKEYMTTNSYTWSDVKQFDRDILLTYNCLDADSTWSLYKKFKGIIEDHTGTWGDYYLDWVQQDCAQEVLLWIEALNQGMPIDETQLHDYAKECEELRDSLCSQFMNHEQLRDGVALYNKLVVESIWENPPQQFRKDGELTHHWRSRQKKYEEAKEVNHLNLNSPKQLGWLLFEYAKIPPPKYNKDKRGNATTPSTDAESLNNIGEVGELLLSYRNKVTELKFLTQLTDNNTNGVFHPSVVLPGTETGRVTSREDIA